jgi:hypothetical protein
MLDKILEFIGSISLATYAAILAILFALIVQIAVRRRIEKVREQAHKAILQYDHAFSKETGEMLRKIFREYIGNVDDKKEKSSGKT